MINQKFKWQAIFALLFIGACTKIDTTRLGSELIPVVDNLNTFDTVLQVIANNYIGNEEYRLSPTSPHVVGGISNDPVFGSSKATLFFEMKPPNYPFTFFPHIDSLVAFDSAVLVLDYLNYYGDSSTPVNLKLYQLNSPILRDSVLLPTYNLNPAIDANHAILWGSANAQANKFRDSIKIKRGDSVYATVVNQLRIRLDQNLANQLFLKDSAGGLGNDTLFKMNLPGFALEADPAANTLFYFNLGGASKIEFYYRVNPKLAVQDTTSKSFTFNFRSGHAVKFETNRTGAEVLTALQKDPVEGKEAVYIQTSPGTSAMLHIPGLAAFKNVNRIINRAELRITQLPNAQKNLAPPAALYLDIIDTTADVVYKGIPYDISPFTSYYCFPANGINYDYFGGITQTGKVNGDSVVYKFNISRYLQSVLSRKEQLYDFRLSAPFYMFYENCANATNGTTPPQFFPLTGPLNISTANVLNPPGKGRIKLAGGAKTVNADVRMQLRIIYTKI